MSGDSEEKTAPASPRKLKKLREKAQVPQSEQMASYLSQVMAILIVISSAPWILSVMQLGIENAIQKSGVPFELALKDVFESGLRIYLWCAVPITFFALCSALLIKLIYQQGFVFAIDPILPKMDRFNLGNGIKRILGTRGWVELGTSLARLTVWGGTCVVLAYAKGAEFLAAVSCGATCLTVIAVDALLLMLSAAVTLYVVSAMFEGLIQRFLFRQEQRMTNSEVKQERKDQYGSKEVRQARRKFQRDLQTSAESVGIDNATMCFYFGGRAVAVRYHPSYAPVPHLAAKALSPQDAATMRDRISDNGWRELECEAIVSGLVGLIPGTGVPEALYGELSEALNKMYG